MTFSIAWGKKANQKGKTCPEELMTGKFDAYKSFCVKNAVGSQLNLEDNVILPLIYGVVSSKE